MIGAARRAEKRAEREETYKGNFVSAFQELHDQGKPWVSVDEVRQVAASRDSGFMAERSFMRLMLGARPDPKLKEGVVEYPPKIGARHILDLLVEDGRVERILPEAVAENLVTHLHGSVDRDGRLYRLAPEPEPAEPVLDVLTTA